MMRDGKKTTLPAKAKGWGDVELVGVREQIFNIPIIRSRKIVSENKFWNLPESVKSELRTQTSRLEEVSRHSARESVGYYRGKIPVQPILTPTSCAWRFDTVIFGVRHRQCQIRNRQCRIRHRRVTTPCSSKHSRPSISGDSDDAPRARSKETCEIRAR